MSIAVTGARGNSRASAHRETAGAGPDVGDPERRVPAIAEQLDRGLDDQLAAALARHAVLLAEGVQPLASLDAEDGLQGIPRVIDAGVDDAAVVGAGLLPGAGQA